MRAFRERFCLYDAVGVMLAASFSYSAFTLNNGVHRTGKRVIAELLDLFIQSFCHLADLASGQIFNAEAMCQFLHF